MKKHQIYLNMFIEICIVNVYAHTEFSFMFVVFFPSPSIDSIFLTSPLIPFHLSMFICGLFFHTILYRYLCLYFVLYILLFHRFNKPILNWNSFSVPLFAVKSNLCNRCVMRLKLDSLFDFNSLRFCQTNGISSKSTEKEFFFFHFYGYILLLLLSSFTTDNYTLVDYSNFHCSYVGFIKLDL